MYTSIRFVRGSKYMGLSKALSTSVTSSGYDLILREGGDVSIWDLVRLESPWTILMNWELPCMLWGSWMLETPKGSRVWKRGIFQLISNSSDISFFLKSSNKSRKNTELGVKITKKSSQNTEIIGFCLRSKAFKITHTGPTNWRGTSSRKALWRCKT